MNLRSPALAALVLSLAACHDDPEIVFVILPGTPAGLTISACGGNASSTGGTDGTGGSGGTIEGYATGTLNIGASLATLSVPAIPSAPTSGTTLTAISGDVTQPGNVLISGTVNVTATTPVTIESSNADLVVSGTLNAYDPGSGATAGITLRAPNGTVFVSGAVRTVNTDGTSDGDAAGAITIAARRIVITGQIDASGETHTAGAGGNGGDVTLTILPDGDHIYFTAGSIKTPGGSGTTAGGAGGDVAMSAVSKLHVFGTVTTSGGSASGSGAVTGGDAGSVTLTGPGGVDVSTTLTLKGGGATTTANAAQGGDGGTFEVIGGLLQARVYGLVDVSGGAATVAGTGAIGGSGGIVRLGTSVIRLLALETGRGTYSTCGGNGETAAGNGGPITFNTDGGADGFVQGKLDTRGGSSVNGNAAGGDGGIVTVKNLGPFGDLTWSADLDTRGGTGEGPGGGGKAGDLLLSANGRISVSGTWTCDGGPAHGSGAGGAGAMLQIWTLSHDVTLAGAISARGGSGAAGAGGQGGRVEVHSDTDGDGNGGAITLAAGASIDVSGGNGATGGSARNDGAASSAAAGSAAVVFDADGTLGSSSNSLTGGIVQNLGSIVARGGVPGGAGGDVYFDGRDATGGAATSPAAGTQDRGGNGAGAAGDFVGD